MVRRDAASQGRCRETATRQFENEGVSLGNTGDIEHNEIGSNDMTQLTLGLDRDGALVANSFDERDPAVLKLLSMAIEACRRRGKYVGICGQGPSDHPDLAEWPVAQGIESVSLNPDTVVDTWLRLTGSDPAVAAVDEAARA